MCMRSQCRCRKTVAADSQACPASNQQRQGCTAAQINISFLFSFPNPKPHEFFFLLYFSFNNTPGGGTKARLSSQVMRTEDRVPAAEAVAAVQTASDAAATKKLQCEVRIFFLSALFRRASSTAVRAHGCTDSYRSKNSKKNS